MNAAIEEAVRLADSNAQMRRDLAGLRHALERANSERDAWRNKYTGAAFRLEQFKFAVAKLCKEMSA